MPRNSEGFSKLEPQSEFFSIWTDFLRDTPQSRSFDKKIKLPESEQIYKILETRPLSDGLSFSKEMNNLDTSFYTTISDTRSLEEPKTSERIDNFITRHLPAAREISIRRLQEIQELPEIKTTHAFRSSTGLHAGFVRRRNFSGLTINGVPIYEGTSARIGFLPEGRGAFDPKRMTDSLIGGIQGIRELVEAIDKGRFEDVKVLEGGTNINMALIAQRLGFRIVDQDRTADGKIDKTRNYFRVIARAEDVRRRLKEIEAMGGTDRLQKRHERLSLAKVTG